MDPITPVTTTTTTVVTEPTTATVKPGFKTTEFWLTAVAVIGGLVMASGVVTELSPVGKIIALGLVTLKTMGYTSQRMEAKLSVQ